MHKKLVINVAKHETRVALLENGTIVELFIEREDDSNIAGNIYKGRVQRVLPGMQAAFVDIGLNQAAFVYVDDVICNDYKEFEQVFIKNSEVENRISGTDSANHTSSPIERNNRHIEELITEGMEIMVQVAKSPIGTKGPRATSHISLPGRFLVIMPTSDHIGISRCIESEPERERLKNIVLSLRKEPYGYIVRTVSEGIYEEKLAKEMSFLNNLWESIQRRYKSAPAPSLLHKELTVSLRAVRDLLTNEAEKLIIDSRSGSESILSFLDTFMPSLKDSVELYEGSEPIFDAYNLEGDISRALRRKVWLKSGGYIVIEHTEALVAIDVNTGRYVGKHNLEETILKTNLEAVKEIAYQIRLRDIGGIIIIDFIDVEKKSNQDKIFNALKEALKKDRSKSHILPMSDMGLIQMTRKRIRQPLTRMLCEPCFYCDGEGYLTSRQTICYNIYREILRDAPDMVGDRLTLRVNPKIADLLLDEENHIITSLEQTLDKRIVIYPNPQLHMEEFDIFEVLKE
ncbi:MAG: Rne/Rng family ribonuclease [Proteobacteria bacterium]|nr:Rne/Rng family ribonuclease [Pseudomonadota bacterium]MBU4288917.1 Rne/Rng family ribonuclease [Pseudomonadota bacterium]MCG2758371.1 Rne/Rng family ribonuclease [Desulfobacteraceae bacterium]